MLDLIGCLRRGTLPKPFTHGDIWYKIWLHMSQCSPDDIDSVKIPAHLVWKNMALDDSRRLPAYYSD